MTLADERGEATCFHTYVKSLDNSVKGCLPHLFQRLPVANAVEKRVAQLVFASRGNEQAINFLFNKFRNARDSG